MIWLPVMATVTAVIAFAVVAGPIVALALGRNGIGIVARAGPAVPWWRPRPP